MAKKQKSKAKSSVNIRIEDAGRLIERAKACRTVRCAPRGGGIYFFGFIGAAVYYISTAAGFWMGVLGVLKAIVWPAFLVFELMKMLGM